MFITSIHFWCLKWFVFSGKSLDLRALDALNSSDISWAFLFFDLTFEQNMTFTHIKRIFLQKTPCKKLKALKPNPPPPPKTARSSQLNHLKQGITHPFTKVLYLGGSRSEYLMLLLHHGGSGGGDLFTLPLPLTASLPLKIGLNTPKRKFHLNQASIFRGENVSFRGQGGLT